MERRQREEPLPHEVQSRILDWMLDSETTLAARNIVTTYRSGYPQSPGATPADPWELRCCILMLEQIPEARGGIEILAESSTGWRAIMAAWENLEESLRDELGTDGLRSMKMDGGKTPRTMRMLREALSG